MNKRQTDALLEVKHLKKHFPVQGGFFKRQVGAIKAVDDVSFTIQKGETFGLVGESGSGKSTTGRTILRLTDATDGHIIFDGEDITHLKGTQLRRMRRNFQMVYQDPYASLNPQMMVGHIIDEPLRNYTKGSHQAVEKQVKDLLERVGLKADDYHRYPHEFSGGQRQRIGIARALALQPKLIVADEPVSALDVSIQAQVINLLKELQDEFSLTYLFIAHDLSMVRYLSDRIGVMKNGRLVEVAESNELYNHPFHPYTQSLLSAVLTPDPRLERHRERMHYDEKMWEKDDIDATLREVRPGHWVRCTEETYEIYKQSL